MRFAYAGLLGLVMTATAGSAMSEPLVGSIGNGSGNGWCAAWLDLQETRSFSRGDRLCIRALGGPDYLMRLKPAGTPGSSPAGMEGAIRQMPQDGSVIEVELSQDHPGVDQISVHACDAAWGIRFQSGNGTIVLSSVHVETGNAPCQ